MRHKRGTESTQVRRTQGGRAEEVAGGEGEQPLLRVLQAKDSRPRQEQVVTEQQRGWMESNAVDHERRRRRGPRFGGRGSGAAPGGLNKAPRRVGGAPRPQVRGHTCSSSLLEAAQDLLTQEMNQPSHNLGAEKESTPNHTF